MQLTCRLTGCPKPAYRRGLCRMHYRRYLKYGGPGPIGMIGKRASIEDRFANNVQINGPTRIPELGPCAIWTGYIHASGYGAIWSGHRLIYVHRYAYEHTYGPIPPNGRVQQLCGNKRCVRADHLTLRRRRP